jgi:hypothetical protein
MGNTSAAQDNLKRARLANSIKFKKKKFAEFDRSLKHLADKIDLEVEKQVIKQLKTVDRKLLKNQIFKVFEKLGGVSGMVTWAKKNDANRKAYYSLMAQLLKAETETQGGGSKGVKVNFMLGGKGKAAIDVTPSKDDDVLNINMLED